MRSTSLSPGIPGLWKTSVHWLLWLAAGLLGVCFPASAQASGRIFSENGVTVIEVVVASLPDPFDNSPGSQAIRAVISDFVKAFPAIFRERYREKYLANPGTYGRFDWDKVEVRLRAFSGLQIEGVSSDLMAIAGGTAPDILYINFNKSDTYIRNGFLYPLDEYLGDLTPEELDERISPKIWPVIRRKGPTGQVNTWALPFGGALGRVLVYRKDLFDAKGLAYPSKDWTWDDLLEAAKRLTDPEAGTYGLFFGMGKAQSQDWVTFLWSAGGEVMEEDAATGDWKVVFGSPEGTTALDFYLQLTTERWTDSQGRLRRGYALRDTVMGQKLASQGKVGMTLGYMDGKLLSQINPEQTGLAPVPKGPGGLRASELNSRMMGLFSGISSPAVRDAAWEYMSYVTSPLAQKEETRILVENGFGRFLNPKLLRRFGFADIERFTPPGWAETFDITIANGKPEPYGKNSNVAYEIMSQPMEEAVQLSLADRLPADPAMRREVLGGLLEKAEARANVIMMGKIPPREKQTRMVTAILFLGAVVIVFAFLFRQVASALSPPGSASQWDLKISRYWPAYLLLLPALLTILVWKYIPLGNGSMMAFQNFKLLGQSTWIGVENFGNVLWDGTWWNAVWNSLRYAALALFLTFLPPVILAVILQEIPKGKLLFRIIFYLPAVLSGLVTLLLWKQFYQPSESGMLNAILLHVPAAFFLLAGLGFFTVCALFAWRLSLHSLWLPVSGFLLAAVALFSVCFSLARPMLMLPGESFWMSLAQLDSRLFSTMPEPVRWLSDPGWAMLACILPAIWAGMGPGCLIYLAALRGIPEDFYQAAEIDGAGILDKVLFVVFPMLKTLLIINFVGAFIHAWYGSADSILAMTGGGANTEVADLHLFYKAFVFLEFGPATAMAWILGFMLVGFTMYQLRILARVEFRTTGGK